MKGKVYILLFIVKFIYILFILISGVVNLDKIILDIFYFFLYFQNRMKK